MSNIIPFEASAGVPAYLQNAESNDDLLAHASTTYPVMSIKGKIFTVVRDGQRAVVPNPKDPDSPAHFIDVAVIKVSPNTSKVYYMQAFKEGEENVKPTCFSGDGKTPDPSSQSPQCKSCAACPHNVFGSARNQDGTPGRGKACSDSVRMAIADLTNIHEPMMLRVPPASIKAIGEYGRVLARRKVPYQAIVTRISFVATEATPKLSFSPIGYLDEPTYREVMEESKSAMVQAIITGMSPSGTSEAEEEAKAEAMEIPDKTYGADGKETAAPRANFSAQAGASPAPKVNEQAAVDKVIAEVENHYSERASQPAAPAAAKVVSTEEELADAISNLGFDE